MVEALDEPQLRARDMIVDLEHPVLGRVPTVGNAIKLSRSPAALRLPPPALGQHTQEILGHSPAREGGSVDD